MRCVCCTILYGIIMVVLWIEYKIPNTNAYNGINHERLRKTHRSVYIKILWFTFRYQAGGMTLYCVIWEKNIFIWIERDGWHDMFMLFRLFSQKYFMMRERWWTNEGFSFITSMKKIAENLRIGSAMAEDQISVMWGKICYFLLSSCRNFFFVSFKFE